MHTPGQVLKPMRSGEPFVCKVHSPDWPEPGRRPEALDETGVRVDLESPDVAQLMGSERGPQQGSGEDGSCGRLSVLSGSCQEHGPVWATLHASSGLGPDSSNCAQSFAGLGLLREAVWQWPLGLWPGEQLGGRGTDLGSLSSSWERGQQEWKGSISGCWRPQVFGLT